MNIKYINKICGVYLAMNMVPGVTRANDIIPPLRDQSIIYGKYPHNLYLSFFNLISQFDQQSYIWVLGPPEAPIHEMS